MFYNLATRQGGCADAHRDAARRRAFVEKRTPRVRKTWRSVGLWSNFRLEFGDEQISTSCHPLIMTPADADEVVELTRRAVERVVAELRREI
jgi:adenosylmethionine-8-amino-7-oxononanoate aminotransferase